MTSHSEMVVDNEMVPSSSSSSSSTNSTTNNTSSLPLIKEGDTILIKLNNGSMILQQHVKPETQLKLGKKQTLALKHLIGQPYYAYYEVIGPSSDSTTNGDTPSVKNNKKNKSFSSVVIKRMLYDPDKEEALTFEPGDDEQPAEEQQEDEEEKLNRLIDNNKSQTLTQDQILELKKQGVEGKEIINKLIEGSKSFQVRSQFSQQKYLKRKKKKYLNYFRVIDPSAYDICDFYFAKNPEKISHMRVDGLAQLLTLGSVFPNRKVMIMETCMGLVTAAVFERIGQYGEIIRVCPDDMIGKHVHAVTYLNIHKGVASSVIKDVSFGKLATARNSDSNEMQDEAVVSEEYLVDCLLIATNQFDPKSVISHLYPFLRESGTFAIYSSYKECLEECHNKLKEDRAAVLVQLTETWMREYQVLPKRTHPMMTTSSSSGYVLSGIKTFI
ncbi:hypothetical protein C9374_008435 [Naegleria lovaniensis]|uniref:tRNA (adenine(58)-N(1))-methyltransferase non-catalytic subunit TRM6 n=1 Tax=Naegleria lovaniensis TaxID=51637 RepID=A0AA88GF44_NAELO|nr:uncharacterized protein C9374_008435 [Naegleria lovaniensis]KAG2378292.1 hypothetical protein C9374_008435 [Naegleria lovaniensis]